MTLAATKPITADELLAMGDIGRCELIYGEIAVRQPAGALHGFTAARFGSYLAEYVEDRATIDHRLENPRQLRASLARRRCSATHATVVSLG